MTSELNTVYDQLVRDLKEQGIARTRFEEGYNSIQAGDGHYFMGYVSMLFTGNPMAVYKPSVVGFHAENGKVAAYLVHNVRAMEGDMWVANDSIAAQGPNKQQFADKADFLEFCKTLQVNLKELVSLDKFLEAKGE